MAGEIKKLDGKQKEDPMVLPLSYPLTIEGKEIKEIRFTRRPLVEEIINGQNLDTNSNVEITIYMAGQISGINPEELRNLDAKDYYALERKMNGFL